LKEVQNPISNPNKIRDHFNKKVLMQKLTIYLVIQKQWTFCRIQNNQEILLNQAKLSMFYKLQS